MHRAILLLSFALAGCQMPPQTCGEYPEGGGPARIRTRDQEMCELVRQRVLRHMKTREEFSLAWAEDVWEESETWKFADDLAELIERIRADAGDELAGDVQRAVEAAQAGSKEGYGAECAEELPEKCLVLGAAKGARMALRQRGYFARGRPIGGGRSDDGSSGEPENEYDAFEHLID